MEIRDVIIIAPIQTVQPTTTRSCAAVGVG